MKKGIYYKYSNENYNFNCIDLPFDFVNDVDVRNIAKVLSIDSKTLIKYMHCIGELCISIDQVHGYL